MGVLKNDVGRPSNKTIMIRNILKGIGLFLVIAIGFFAGYYLSNNKNDNKKDTISIEENYEGFEAIADSLYSNIKNYEPFKLTDKGLLEKICGYYCDDLIVKNMANDEKMSIVASNFKLDTNSVIEKNEFDKKYEQIFGEKVPTDKFYNLSLYKTGNVVLNNNYYEFKEETTATDFDLSGEQHYLVKKEKIKNKIYLYEVNYYTNESSFMGDDEQPEEYEVYSSDSCKSTTCKVIFKYKNKNDLKEKLKKYESEFSKTRFDFVLKNNEYIFESVKRANK